MGTCGGGGTVLLTENGRLSASWKMGVADWLLFSTVKGRLSASVRGIKFWRAKNGLSASKLFFPGVTERALFCSEKTRLSASRITPLVGLLLTTEKTGLSTSRVVPAAGDVPLSKLNAGLSAS